MESVNKINHAIKYLIMFVNYCTDSFFSAQETFFFHLKPFCSMIRIIIIKERTGRIAIRRLAADESK